MYYVEHVYVILIQGRIYECNFRGRCAAEIAGSTDHLDVRRKPVFSTVKQRGLASGYFNAGYSSTKIVHAGYKILVGNYIPGKTHINQYIRIIRLLSTFGRKIAPKVSYFLFNGFLEYPTWLMKMNAQAAPAQICYHFQLYDELGKSHESQWHQRSMQLMVKVVLQIYQWSSSTRNWINLYISNIFWLHCTERIDTQICHLESQHNDVTQGFMRHKLPALRQFVDEVISRNGPTKNKIIHEKTLQWRHNECDGVSNYRRLHCLLIIWFRGISKETSRLRVTGLWAGNSPLTGERPVTWKMFPFDDFIMIRNILLLSRMPQDMCWDHYAFLQAVIHRAAYFRPGSAFIKPDQRNPWIKDQIKITLLPTISHLLLPNFVSCGRDKPSHMTQNLVTVGAKLWTAERFLIDPWSMDYADPVW